MTAQLQQVLDAARCLPARDKLELPQALSQDLNLSDVFAKESAAFWMLRSIDEIASSQSAPVVTDVRSLSVDFWPENESADDFNQFIEEQRRADRMRHS